MQLSKITTLLLGSVIVLTPLHALSATQKTAQKTQTTAMKKVEPPKKIAKATDKKSDAKAGKSPAKKAEPKQVAIKKAEPKKSSAKKAESQKSGTKKVEVKKSSHKDLATKPESKVKQAVKSSKVTTKKAAAKQKATGNTTKHLYGVKGIALKPTKVSDRRYTYREKGKTYTSSSKEASRMYSQTGVASYYGGMFHGRKTANGEIFNKNAYTAAHKTLALGSYALVTNLRNGRKVIVKVNDRGPFSKQRIIDLSVASAREIGMLHSGVARVKVEAMQVDSQGYITGKAAHSLYAIAKRMGLPLKVKGSGNNFAIKAE